MKEERVAFGEVADELVDQGGPVSREFVYVDIGSIDRDTKCITNPKFLEKSKAPSRARQRLKHGDVLISMTRPNLNAVALVTKDLDGSIGSTGFYVLRSKWIDSKFLFYLVQTREFIDDMSLRVQGALYPAVRPKDISSYIFLLPSSLTQRRTVAKIEELFSELDKGIENLKTAREQLKVYRQAVLKHAFEGKLTAQWRAENKDKLQAATDHPSEIQTLDSFSVPDAWKWSCVRNLLLEGPTNGRSVKDRADGFPVLRLTALKNGRIDLSEFKHGDWDREAALPFVVKSGDFLLSRGNGSKHLVGRGGVVPVHQGEIAYPDTMVRLRIDPQVIH